MYIPICSCQYHKYWLLLLKRLLGKSIIVIVQIIKYTVDESFGRFQYIWLEFHLSQIKCNSLTILSCTWHRYKIFVRMIMITNLSFKISMVSYDFDLFDWRFELLVIFFFNLRLFIFWFTLYLFLRIKISTSYHNNVGKTKVPEDFFTNLHYIMKKKLYVLCITSLFSEKLHFQLVTTFSSPLVRHT